MKILKHSFFKELKQTLKFVLKYIHQKLIFFNQVLTKLLHLYFIKYKNTFKKFWY